MQSGKRFRCSAYGVQSVKKENWPDCANFAYIVPARLRYTGDFFGAELYLLWLCLIESFMVAANPYNICLFICCAVSINGSTTVKQ